MQTIRRLAPTDVLQYRDLRLQALKSDPVAFLATFESEVQKGPISFEAELRYVLSEPCFGYYGVFNDTDLIAFCQLNPAFLPKQRHLAFLYNLYVTPTERHRGIATTLLKHLLNQLQEKTVIEQIFITYLAGNTGARKLYDQLGFRECGRRPHSVKWEDKYDDEVEMYCIVQN